VVRRAYKLYEQDEAFQSVIYPGVGHVYLPEMWDRTLAWFDEKLKK
jgi:hypothetical protein